MRIFICFDTSEEVEDVLRKTQKEFKGFGNINFVNEFHCTLKFLGDVNENQLDLIKERLSSIKFKPFKVELSPLGVFPNENYIRVLWVGLKGKILELQHQVDASLVGLFDKEKDFVPHLTLGRVKFLENKTKFKEKLSVNVEGEFVVKEFKLMKSELTKTGAVYEVLKTYKAE